MLKTMIRVVRDLETRFHEFDFKFKQINSRKNIQTYYYSNLKITFTQYVAIPA
jgi:hypothetical protein